MTEINFETINDELTEQLPGDQLPVQLLNVTKAETAIVEGMDLTPFIASAERFEIVDRQSAHQCLSMTLQARKMRQVLDKKRLEIVRPALEFQKSINSFCKKYENTLLVLEDHLAQKVKEFMKTCTDTGSMDFVNTFKVEDGTASKKLKWTYQVENEIEIPREFLCIDEKKVQFAIKNGLRHIPGLKIFENVEIDLRVKNG